MQTPFTAIEIKKATKKMKPGRSPGCDQVSVELITHAPNSIFERIAEIFNNLAVTGDCPNEISHGIQQIPINQAAYRKNRSTTEHVFAAKLVTERTITAKNETVYLTLLDMSKAFDSILRKQLIDDLQHTINEDELYMMKRLLEVTLKVKCGESFSNTFITDTRAPQGDCASETNLLSI